MAELIEASGIERSLLSQIVFFNEDHAQLLSQMFTDTLDEIITVVDGSPQFHTSGIMNVVAVLRLHKHPETVPCILTLEYLAVLN